MLNGLSLLNPSSLFEKYTIIRYVLAVCIYLLKDKNTGDYRGFAFVHYYKKDNAQKAIATLNGFGYDHLILNVEWAKPSEPK